MRILIVEDEHLAAQRLRKMVGELYPQAVFCMVCDSIEQTVEWINSHQPVDFAFFDIQLGDGLSFEVFEQCEVNFPVIFTTAYDQYAIKAFKVNSLDYLLKPLNKQELKDAVDKYLNSQLQDIKTIQLAISQANTSIQQQHFKTRYLIKVGEHLRMLNTSDISCFYSESKATYVCNMQGANYAMDQSLEQLELQLNPAKFYRISRKYLINIEAINDIVSFGTSRLKLKLAGTNTTEEIIVSRERVKAFKAWLEEESQLNN